MNDRSVISLCPLRPVSLPGAGLGTDHADGTGSCPDHGERPGRLNWQLLSVVKVCPCGRAIPEVPGGRGSAIAHG